MGRSHSNLSKCFRIFTIAQTGNGADFGDLTDVAWGACASNSPTRAVRYGGEGSGGSPGTVNVMDYWEMSSLGNAIDFGDLTTTIKNQAASNSFTRGICAAGRTPSLTAVMDTIIFASLGNATDWGDVTAARQSCSGSSSLTRGITCGVQLELE